MQGAKGTIPEMGNLDSGYRKPFPVTGNHHSRKTLISSIPFALTLIKFPVNFLLQFLVYFLLIFSTFFAIFFLLLLLLLYFFAIFFVTFFCYIFRYFYVTFFYTFIIPRFFICYYQIPIYFLKSIL